MNAKEDSDLDLNNHDYQSREATLTLEQTELESHRAQVEHPLLARLNQREEEEFLDTFREFSSAARTVFFPSPPSPGEIAERLVASLFWQFLAISVYLSAAVFFVELAKRIRRFLRRICDSSC